MGCRRLSKYDNYFELGGNSLSAIRLINALNEILHTNITASVIFQQNTVYKLACLIEKNIKKKNELVDLMTEGGEI